MIHKFEVKVQEFEMQDVVDAYQAFEDSCDGGFVTANNSDIATGILGQIIAQAGRKGVKFTFAGWKDIYVETATAEEV